MQSAVELKYLVRGWRGLVDGERFELKSQGAHDIRAYDVVKDIVRVERFVADRPGSNGVVVCLSNDSLYWRSPTHGRTTNADAFRLHDGVVLSGSRSWGPLTGQGTSKRREQPLMLSGTYRLQWRDYSRQQRPGPEFKVLVVPVES